MSTEPADNSARIASLLDRRKQSMATFGTGPLTDDTTRDYIRAADKALQDLGYSVDQLPKPPQS